MITTWAKTNTVLLLGSLFLFAGCLQEDSVTITKDGLVSFTSVVTEPDEQKQLKFSAFEKAVANTVDELRQHKWKAEAIWTSNQRPYGLKISGSGKLSEVVGFTTFYNLSKVDDKTYKVSFLVADKDKLRVAFESLIQGSAAISDSAGKPVHTIESASSKDAYTIVLP